MPPKEIYRLAILWLVSGSLLSLHAQPMNVQQFQNTQSAQELQRPLTGWLANTNPPELYPGENTDTGPQHILRYTPRPDYFDVFFDSQAFYSSDANYAEGASATASMVYVNTIQAAVTPPEWKLGTGKFTTAAGYVSQWYDYSNEKLHSLDFNAQTAFVSGRYSVGNWQFGLGGNYTRLLDQNNNEQTYSEWLPAFTIQRFIPVRDNLLISLGNQIDYHFTTVPAVPGTSTEINNRFDEAVTLTVSWLITRQLSLQPYYRFQFSNYRYNTLQTSDRNDYLNSFGLTLTYAFNQTFSVRCFFNANINQSNDPYVPAYHEYNEGIGANLNFAF